MSIQTIKCGDRADWLDRRQQLMRDPGTFGASEIAAVMGEDPDRSPFSVYVLHTTGRDEFEGSDFTKWGLRQEQPIAEWVCEQLGCELVPLGDTIFLNDEFPHLHATPDFHARKMGAARQILDKDRGIRDSDDWNLQIKNVGAHRAHRWSEDSPPLEVIIQVQAEMAASGVAHTVVGACIGGTPPQAFHVERNDRFIACLREVTDEFWQRVQAGNPPEITEHAAASSGRAVKLLHPDDNGLTATLGSEYDDLIAVLVRTKEEEAGARATIEYLSTKLRRAIGENTFGVTPGGRRYSLKTVSRRGYTVEATKFRELRKARKA